MSHLCNILVMNKVVLMKTSERTRKRNLERLEEIGDIIRKRQKVLFDENGCEDVTCYGKLLLQLFQKTHDNKAHKPRGKIKLGQTIFRMKDL